MRNQYATNWRNSYIHCLRWVDAAIITASLTAAQLARFGFDKSDLKIGNMTVSYWACGILLGLAWYVMLGAWDSRKIRIIGSGTEEFKLVVTATSWLFGTVAIISYAFNLDTARGYILLALPLGSAGILLARWIQRQLLHRKRRFGLSTARVMVVAGPFSAAHLTKSLARQPFAGFTPVAVHVPGLSINVKGDADVALGAPLAGTGESVEDILDSISRFEADTVALSSGLAMPPHKIRDLGWALADRHIRLIMAPALTDIAGPRIHVQPVSGLPLVHVSTPQFSSGARFAKRIFDIVSSSLLIIVLSPLFVVLASVVKATGGPALFKQPRVGLQGQIFEMLKFRSMVVGADEQVAGLIDESDGNGVMFKMKNDPRVTSTGKWMRRFSLDELPQLFNVIAGNMSLVGPRPPLESEAAVYEKHVHRRFMVKPGITGLWQVSGRSDLSWQDTVRLDLYYVENWSLAGDFIILLKTLKAVMRSGGAY
ncbi:sugar transferase [Arthrobacter sp. A2-55]|uniref:sugar transferase n=1 Tax=Arthrobacter sp. A2-55 TaxID=2897337 RepID=UPI0021CD796E|nr:sugar transferase [Arthrobacter sp. A2-55]MCU6479917.1 sugar transferase [Arthrobacter sp. A2-55]